MSRTYGHPALEANRWTALAVLTFARTAMGFRDVPPSMSSGETAPTDWWLARPVTMVTLGLLAYAVGLAALPYARPWPTLPLGAARAARARGADQAGRD
jgi:hypothetical protein